jgi:hypothetical protein
MYEYSLVHIGKSQPAKNRNLSRLLANLSRLNWSSERNSGHCFSTVFTLLQQEEVPSTDIEGQAAEIKVFTHSLTSVS